MPSEVMASQPLCANIDGLGLYAAVRVEAHDRKRLEQLRRYIRRPALLDERVQLNAAGQVDLKLNTSWRDSTTHLVMSPLEAVQRLAALVPRLRPHLRFHPRSGSWAEGVQAEIKYWRGFRSISATAAQFQKGDSVAGGKLFADSALAPPCHFNCRFYVHSC
jgi:hypothetical protein